MTRRAKRIMLSMHPAAFAAGYVLLSFANLPTPAIGLWRPLAVAIITALILSLVFGAVARNRAVGALLATVIVLAISAWWLLIAVVIIAVAWIGLVSLLRRWRNAAAPRWSGWDHANRLIGIFGAMFAVVAVLSAAPAVIESLQLRIPDAVGDAGQEDGPNIYVVVLDAHPRSDVLREHLGLDNSSFVTELTELGFDVAMDSRSNYSATWATLASMFHGSYLHEIASLTPFATDQTEQLRSLMRALNEGPLLGELRGRGYRLVTTPSPMEIASLTTADHVASGGHLTFFELSLVQHSQLIGPLMALAPDLLWNQQRDRLRHALDTTVAVAEEAAGDPTFMFTHILNPHAPIIFGPGGEKAGPPSCFPASCTPWEIQTPDQWAAFPGQVEHLGSLVTEAVGQIVAADADGVVVVMSDHGLQPPGAPESAKLSNLLAVRSPGHPELMAGEPHLVDLLPTILNTYLGADLPTREYRGWISEAEHPLQVTEVGASPAP